jgi:hypothetical protein
VTSPSQSTPLLAASGWVAVSATVMVAVVVSWMAAVELAAWSEQLVPIITDAGFALNEIIVIFKKYLSIANIPM